MKEEYYIVQVGSRLYVKSYYKDMYCDYLHTTSDIYRAKGTKNLETARRLVENAKKYYASGKGPDGLNLRIGVIKVTISTEEVE